MAQPIIEAVRAFHDLKESLFHTAKELAHLASIYGVLRHSLAYLALKCHCSVRTMQRHIDKLIARQILKKTVIWIKGNLCEINTYTFCIPWRREPAQTSNIDTMSRNLPPQEEREKNLSIRDEIRNQEKFLRMYDTPGSYGYVQAQDRLTYLRNLLQGPSGGNGH